MTNCVQRDDSVPRVSSDPAEPRSDPPVPNARVKTNGGLRCEVVRCGAVFLLCPPGSERQGKKTLQMGGTNRAVSAIPVGPRHAVGRMVLIGCCQ